ncbi:MAG: hypothetical protein H6748_07300 [Spirochaetaceae bacterium]|nr:hypothetical protein [Myxococcales bacterium]MCB9723832.1 hypothetical protein [Spirochaetaceae bacterium]
MVERAPGTSGADPIVGRADLARFEAFYDFAFPRVYRFAARRMDTRERAEALCSMILESALARLGGLCVTDEDPVAEPAELALALFSIAKQVAARVEREPSLLARPRLVEGISCRPAARARRPRHG